MTKECSCAKGIIKTILNLNDILDEIRNSEINKKDIPPATIGKLTGNAIRSVSGAEDAENFCSINLARQINGLNTIKRNVLTINDPSSRNIINKLGKIITNELSEELDKCVENR